MAKPLIRPARAEDAPALSALALRSKAHWGYDQAFMSACVPELTVTAEQIRQHPAHLAEVDGQIVGFYLLESLSQNEVELGFLFVEPAWIGRGCGRHLLRHAMDTATRLGFGKMVIQGDPNADGFYRSMGAICVGSKPSASISGRLLPLYEVELSLRKGPMGGGSV